MSDNAHVREDRITGRRRVLKAGVVAYNGRHVTLPCSVRDMSATGARITVSGSVPAPDTFELLIELDGLEVPCAVVWRRGSEVGVRFVEPPRYVEKKREQVIHMGKAARPTLRRKPITAT